MTTQLPVLSIAIEYDSEHHPNEFKLYQNYPNPFNSYTTIFYHLSNREYIELQIYDMNGRLVKKLVNNEQQPGTYSIIWNGLDEAGVKVTSGIYICRLEAGNHLFTCKMILTK